MGFPGGSVGKESACNAGDTETQVRSLGQEDPLEEGTGNPLLYSCQENPMDRQTWRGAVQNPMDRQTWLVAVQNPMDRQTWRVVVHRVAKSRT